MNALAQGAAQALATYVVTALWMSAVVGALAALVVRFWKPLDAASRYAVWYVALIAIVLGPLATTVAVQYANRGPSAADLAAALNQVHDARKPVEIALPRAHVRIALPPPVVFGAAALWLLVVLGGAARFAAGIVVLARLKRDALPLCPQRRGELPLWNAHAGAANARRARLCVSDRVDVPVAVGLYDAMVVLPQQILDAFEPHDVDRFVLHELAHLERRDDWTTAFERLAQIVLFFNPVVHLIARRLDLEREIACDDRVIAETSDVRSYAVGLTRMAESTAWPHHAIAAPAIFATRKQLSLRVEELLGSRRFTAQRLAVAPAALALAASLGVVAAAAARAPSVGIGASGSGLADALYAVPNGATRTKQVKFVLIHRIETQNKGKPRRYVVYRSDTDAITKLPTAELANPRDVDAFMKQLDVLRTKHPSHDIVVRTVNQSQPR